MRKSDSGKRMSRMLTSSYMNLHQKAKEDAFVVWIAIIVPAEIFLGFENVIYAVPESHAALSAGKGVGSLQSAKAEGMGYSMDLCSYARIDIGTAFDGGKDSPTFGLPRPHLLISNNNNCSLLVKWFDVYHREWGIPHFIMDVPFCYKPQKEKDLGYIMAQFRDLIQLIEKMSGQKFDIDRVRDGVAHTVEAVKQWKRFIGFAAHRPSGITAFDTFVQMAPFLTSRGTPELAEHYRLLADETAEKVTSGIFPCPMKNTGSSGTISPHGTSFARCRSAWPSSRQTSSPPAILTAWDLSKEISIRTNTTESTRCDTWQGSRIFPCAPWGWICEAGQ